MAEKTKIIDVGGYEDYAHVSIAWESDRLTIGTFTHEGIGQSLTFGLDTLDELLDALHQARVEVAGTKRIARMLRLPIKLKNRLEARVRRQGGNQNAAIIEAIEQYLAE